MKTIKTLCILILININIKSVPAPQEIFFIFSYLKQDIEQIYLPNYYNYINNPDISIDILEPAVKDLIQIFKITKQYTKSNNNEIICYLENYLQAINNGENFQNTKLLTRQNLATIFITKQLLLTQILKEASNPTRSSSTFSTFFTGLVHTNDSGIFYSSLLIDADIDLAANISDAKLATISTIGKVANSATTATSANTANAIVARDTSNGFSVSNVLFGNGTNSAPSLGFISETNSGIYKNGANSIGVAVGGANKALFEATGLRYLNNFKVDVYSSANRILAAATELIRYNTVNIDSNNNFNTSTYTYTAPVTGTYLVSAQVGIITTIITAGTKTLQLLKNGNPVTGYTSLLSLAISSTGNLSLMKLISLTANDTLTFQFSGLINDTLLADSSNLSIILVSI